MQLAYIRDLAESSLNGEKVSDVVLTVPPFYTQHERDAVIDAVEIAGMRTLALVHDGSAVAINYAMTRTFTDKPEHHIIYDAGASSIRASIVSFLSIDAKSKNAGTSIRVAGLKFERQVGGNELNRRLREILIKYFGKKHRTEVRNDKQVLAKLWKEANRVRRILSANTDSSPSVSSCLEISKITNVYTEFRLKVLPTISTTGRKLQGLSLRVHVATLLVVLSSLSRTHWLMQK